MAEIIAGKARTREMRSGKKRNEMQKDAPLRHIYRGSQHLLLVEIEADASKIEGLNALTEAAWIERKVLEWERSGEEPGIRDRKRVIIERSEGMGDWKARKG